MKMSKPITDQSIIKFIYKKKIQCSTALKKLLYRKKKLSVLDMFEI